MALFIHEEQLECFREDVRKIAEVRNPDCTDMNVALAFCGAIYSIRWMRFYKLPDYIQ